jgi:serine protease Do
MMRTTAVAALVVVAGVLAALLVVNMLNAHGRAGGRENPAQALSTLDRPVREVSHVSGGVSFVDAVKKLAPAVVAIEVRGVRQDWLRAVRFKGMGSGVVISKDGYVVTNAHVVEDASAIVVRTIDGKEYGGVVVGKDFRHDLAVLKVRATDMAFAELGDSDALQVGEWVMAIGNPLGFENTLTVGVVSAKNREFSLRTGAAFTDLIQTDAAINQGNSGGALANVHGQVVGVNTIIASTSGGNIGLGFAVPINRVREVVKRLVEHQRMPIPFVGAVPNERVDLSDPEWRDALRRTVGAAYNQDYGVVIDRVLPYSPSYDAGLRQLDVVEAVDGKKLRTVDDFWEVVQKSDVGDTLEADVWRSGAAMKIRITVGDLPDDFRERLEGR